MAQPDVVDDFYAIINEQEWAMGRRSKGRRRPEA